MTRKLPARLRAAATLVLTGAALCQFGLGACADIVEIVNPCGSVFSFCSQEDLFRLVNPVPDFENDPGCTIPGECDPGSVFPPFPGPRPQGPP